MDKGKIKVGRIIAMVRSLEHCDYVDIRGVTPADEEVNYDSWRERLFNPVAKRKLTRPARNVAYKMKLMNRGDPVRYLLFVMTRGRKKCESHKKFTFLPFSKKHKMQFF